MYFPMPALSLCDFRCVCVYVYTHTYIHMYVYVYMIRPVFAHVNEFLTVSFMLSKVNFHLVNQDTFVCACIVILKFDTHTFQSKPFVLLF